MSYKVLKIMIARGRVGENPKEITIASKKAHHTQGDHEDEQAHISLSRLFSTPAHHFHVNIGLFAVTVAELSPDLLPVVEKGVSDKRRDYSKRKAVILVRVIISHWIVFGTPNTIVVKKKTPKNVEGEDINQGVCNIELRRNERITEEAGNLSSVKRNR
ncbi:hypothetical protein BJ875DRAFT_445178 [Amylocarpus encephaloides]|uniref:Uncharacterized protein n=1 Tax=Amylocarpus encephaloides TaxID=45428 RepID=A0A9P7YBB0_9HELO|nr:hypothetical protein BJ875DRAFT_445178 [Amylocarpus encephaloides]